MATPDFNAATIATSLIPVVTYGVKRVIGSLTGGPVPQTVDDVIRLKELDVRQFEALSQADQTPSNESRWVSNLRALQRPIVVYLIMLTFLGSVAYYSILGTIDYNDLLNFLTNMTASVIFYLFGDRSFYYFHRNIRSGGSTGEYSP